MSTLYNFINRYKHKLSEEDKAKRRVRLEKDLNRSMSVLLVFGLTTLVIGLVGLWVVYAIYGWEDNDGLVLLFFIVLIFSAGLLRGYVLTKRRKLYWTFAKQKWISKPNPDCDVGFNTSTFYMDF